MADGNKTSSGGTATAALIASAASLLVGCGDDVCGDECTAGVSCSEVYEVPSDYELGEAAAQAGAGSCIALAPGTYGEVTLPGGVSLLGPGADQVTVGTVTVSEGADPVIRRLKVAGVIKLRPHVADARLDSLHVTGSKNGVQAEQGASFTLVDSQIVGVPDNSVLAIDAARVTISRTEILQGGGPGVWVQCGQGCDCESPTEVALDNVTVSASTYVGISLLGAEATMEAVDISGVHDEGYTGNGGGLSVSGCSNVTSGKAVSIDSSSGFGVLVDDASVDLGGDADNAGIIIINNMGGGVWLQNIGTGQGARLEGATVENNGGMGIDVGEGSQGIIIINNRVASTASDAMPAHAWVQESPNGPLELTPVGLKTIGDGFVWHEAADVQIEGLTLSGNARTAMLIDGAVAEGSMMADVTLEQGDEALGIVQQRTDQADQAPAIAGSTPSVSQTDVALHDLAIAPLPPAAI